MKFVIQRVIEAKCVVEQKIIGEIKKGYCVLIGISNNDTYEIADKMIKKMLNLRIFADENDKTNLSLNDVNGELLLISQFTLYANCKKGNRPSFIDAGKPDIANEMYQYIISVYRNKYSRRVSNSTAIFFKYLKNISKIYSTNIDK